MPKDKSASKYWLDQIVDEAIERQPEGEIITASGHAPSGQYHVGHLRELLTPSVIAWAIKQRSRAARHIDFVDDFDPLRKVPAGVDTSFKQHLGKPLHLVPDPFKCQHDSYGEHFLQELYDSTVRLGIEPEIVRSHLVYREGRFTEAIETTLKSLEQVREIIENVSGRQLPKDWAPVQLLSDNEHLDDWSFAGWDKSKQVIQYRSQQGQEGELDYTKGRVKLNWRLDWPARWGIWGVSVEPFGRDHASKGGSYDTGKELAEQVFKAQPPLPLPFDFINLSGHTKKMSASAGTGVTPQEVLNILPAEVLRYFVVKARPAKPLQFDTELGVVKLWDEFKAVEQSVFAKTESEFGQAYQAAKTDQEGRVTSAVPFDHLVSVYQAAQGDLDKVKELLERSGYQQAAKEQLKLIEQEVNYVKNWLENYAPAAIKFSLQEQLPKVDLSAEQKAFLVSLAKRIEQTQDLDAQGMHETIYAVRDETKLEPKEAFGALYQVLFNQDSGPKAGWFLASLDPGWLTKRLRLEG